MRKEGAPISQPHCLICSFCPPQNNTAKNEVASCCYACGWTPLPHPRLYLHYLGEAVFRIYLHSVATSLLLHCYLALLPQESSVVTAEKPVISGNIVSRELILTTAPSDNMATYRCNASNLSKIPALTAYTRLHIQCKP